ncbi:MAG TPA: radical SAM protein [Spirochaetota bacterium]|nr:radical SAM protein [Spirochaetota bacterium]
MSKTRITIPVFVPHAGCRHACVFCNQWKVSGSSTESGVEDLNSTVTRYLSAVPETVRRVEIAFFGGSFTGIDMLKQARLLEAAESYVQKGLVHAIRLSTRPDYIDNEKLSLLKQFSVETVELGVQSFDDAVLRASGRGHTAADVYNAVDLLKKYAFRTGIQLMPGLPCDTREKSIYSADETVRLHPDDSRIYPCVVLAGTELEAMYGRGEFKPLDLEEAVDISAEMYRRLIENRINVIRIGLHPLENTSAVIDGPYHTAMGFMVKSRYRRFMLDSLFSGLEPGTGISIRIAIPFRFSEEYIGLRKCNIEYLKAKHSLHTLEYELRDIASPEIIS